MYVSLPDFVDRGGPGDVDPYDNFSWLRSAMPVAQMASSADGKASGGKGSAWFVTGYELARACLADPRLSVDRRNAANAGHPDGHPDEEEEGDLLGKDPPDHSRLRRLLSPSMSPGASERFRPFVQEVCDGLIDAFREDGEANLVSQYAWPIPWYVMHEFLGVPEAERMDAARCVDRFLVAGYHEQQDGGPATEELMDYTRQLIAYKRAHRGADVTTVLIEGRESGEVRSENELVNLLFMLLGAGIVSTGLMISGGILRLLQNPGELAKLNDGTAEWKTAVEEAMRYDSPVQTSVLRFARTDLDLGGAKITKGDTLIISLAGANRDPAKFADAERFSIDQRRSHLAFGHGVHLCTGAPLARIEGEIALRTAFRRLPDLRLTAPAQHQAWVLGPSLRGPREVQVQFETVPAHTLSRR